MNRTRMFLLALTTVLACQGSSISAQEAKTPAGLLMESMFSPQHAPPHQMMGLAQRSFLDVVEESDAGLQLALVVDGTESMTDCLDDMKNAITKMIADLQRFRGNNVSFQLVVFRDAGAGEQQLISMPLNVSNNSFSADVEALKKVLSQIKAESGAPYFHELIDLGIHQALTKLDWSDDEDTSRWIMVFGDAPPYESGFHEEQTHASRRIETGQLVSLANRMGVNIHCVLCTSRTKELEAYKSALLETRGFMGTITTQTGGLLVDLSYDDIRKNIEATSQKPKLRYRPLEPITEEDVEQRRQATAQNATQMHGRIAVLPHLPLNKMSFDVAKPEVLVAAELRHKLRMVKNADVASVSQVRRLFTALERQHLPESQFIQTLANGLSVDYVVWGSVRKLPGDEGTVEVKSAIYARDTGHKLVEHPETSNFNVRPVQNITNNMARELIRLAASTGDNRLATVFRATNTVMADVIRPVSATPESRDRILKGFELAEEALAHPDERGNELLAEAEALLRRATADDTKNATAALLWANCCFNQARNLEQAGDADAAKAKAREYANILSLARRRKSSAPTITQTEIEADYALFIHKDGARAIAEYAKLINAQDPEHWNLHTALRAHWMLAGIYSGDWGVKPDVVDAQKARLHLIEILANWPKSHEAEFIRRSLRWNERAGETRYPHFPLENDTVSRMIET